MSESATGSVSAERIKTTLTIQVDTIDYDSEGGVLRVGGPNIGENKFVKVLQPVNYQPKILVWSIPYS